MNRGGCGPFVKLVVEDLNSILLTINLFIMNKKFSTLMALALLAGSFPVAAQFCPEPNGEIQYHSRTLVSR